MAPVGMLAALAVLTGCSQSPEVEKAAGGVLGTRVCVKNFSSTTPTVTFTNKDTARGEGRLERSTQACAEGSSAGLGLDVGGEIAIPGSSPRSLKLIAQNPWVGAPMAFLSEPGLGGFNCTAINGMDINEARLWDDGLLKFVVTRLGDGQWKEFTVDISDSQSPSADGKPRRCTIKST
ncbi:MAG: hypothetical protein PHN51_02675 [Candidatus Nanopelagicales bacterium]|nr:hypothetical protein [Candidatus Nanopelagicales bacterium]